MPTHIVTGFLHICLSSRWTEACVRVEVKAGNADQARDRVLAAHQFAAEQHDPQATVVWQERPNVRRVPALAWAA
jgi:hypothetical protein